MNTPNNQMPTNIPANPNMNTHPIDIATRDEMPTTNSATAADVAASKAATADATTTTTPDAKTGQMTTPDAATAMADPTTKRDQLQRRVNARVAELEKALGNLQGQSATSEHANSLRTELQLAQDAVGGGWDHVGEVEAMRLSKWLDATQVLTDSVQATPPSAEAFPSPTNGEPKHTALPADGAVATDGKAEAAANA